MPHRGFPSKMKTGIHSKTPLCLLVFAILCLLFGARTARAQHDPPEGVAIDGRNSVFIESGAPPDKSYGTLFKRRGDIQTFRIRNEGSFTWLLSISSIPSNFEVRIPPQPNVLSPGTTSDFTIGYLGGPTPPNSFFRMIFQNTTDAMHRDFYHFELDNTPKKRKAQYVGETKGMKVRDASGSTAVPKTPMTLNLPIGRGAFNGTLWTSQSGVFTQNVSFQGRIQDFSERRGGKKMVMEGFWRWKMERLGFPGRSMGRFRWNLQTNNNKETIISGNLSAASGGNGGSKSRGYSLSGRFRGKLKPNKS